MLLLTRKAGEVLVIGSGERAILVQIVEARGSQARVAITAPDDVGIVRLELLSREEQERYLGMMPGRQ